MKLHPEKLIMKSTSAELLKKLEDLSLKKKVISEYTRLLNENNLSDKMLRKHQTGSIYPAIAIHRVLKEQGYSKEESGKLIRKAVLNKAIPMAKAFQRAGKIPFFFSLFRLMCPASVKSLFGETGWDMRWISNNKNEIRWDCHSCFYHNEFLRYGMSELTDIFCESDDLVYGKIPGITWGRTKTIGRGADVCDFTFYRSKL